MTTVNKVFLIGYLGQDPETRYMPNGDPVTNFSIATTQRWKNKAGEQQEETEWHRIVAYNRLAEIAGEYLKKGAHVCVQGRIHTRSWVDKEGVKRYTVEIIGTDLQMLSRGGDSEQTEQPRRSKPARKDGGLSEMEDDIPFLYNTSSVFIAMLTAPTTARENARYGKENVREVRRLKAALGVLPAPSHS